MRHRNSGRSFSRTSSHRKAMFSNMCCSLIEHGLIKTTLPKAKDLRRYIEPLITGSKVDSVASRRQAFDVLRSKSAVARREEAKETAINYRENSETRKGKEK